MDHQRTALCRLAFSVVMVLTVFVLGVGQTFATELPDTIERVKPAIVGIGTMQQTRRPPAQLLGTGFAVGDGRHVLTNAHVTSRVLDSAQNEFLAVFIGSGSSPEVRRAQKVAVDYEHDLALLKVSGTALPTLRLDNSDRVREGERYVFTGFPIGSILGLYPATHGSLVSAVTPIVIPMGRAAQLNRESIKRLNSPYLVFQLDGTAYPGNSGSPLYDPDTGAVVGVVNMAFVKKSKEAALSDPSGISYAIPVNYVKSLLGKAGLSY